TPDPFGKATQFRVQGCLAAYQPITQSPVRPLPDQIGELVRQIQRGRELLAPDADRMESRRLGGAPVLRPASPLARQVPGPWGGCLADGGGGTGGEAAFKRSCFFPAAPSRLETYRHTLPYDPLKPRSVNCRCNSTTFVRPSARRASIHSR